MTVNLTPVFDSLIAALPKVEDEESRFMSLANTRARLRMTGKFRQSSTKNSQVPPQELKIKMWQETISQRQTNKYGWRSPPTLWTKSLWQRQTNSIDYRFFSPFFGQAGEWMQANKQLSSQINRLVSFLQARCVWSRGSTALRSTQQFIEWTFEWTLRKWWRHRD